MASIKSKNSRKYAILHRLFDKGEWDLVPGAARCLLKLSFDKEDRERMHELARKASANQLSHDEQREADFYEFLGLFLDLLHSRARLSLKREKAGT